MARSIAAVIGATEKQNGYWQGGGYLVSWCIGHLVSFAEAGQYDEKYCKWRYEDLPILPQPWQFIVPDEKKQQFEVLRALLNRPDVDLSLIHIFSTVQSILCRPSWSVWAVPCVSGAASTCWRVMDRITPAARARA